MIWPYYVSQGSSKRGFVDCLCAFSSLLPLWIQDSERSLAVLSVYRREDGEGGTASTLTQTCECGGRTGLLAASQWQHKELCHVAGFYEGEDKIHLVCCCNQVMNLIFGIKVRVRCRLSSRKSDFGNLGLRRRSSRKRLTVFDKRRCTSHDFNSQSKQDINLCMTLKQSTRRSRRSIFSFLSPGRNLPKPTELACLINLADASLKCIRRYFQSAAFSLRTTFHEGTLEASDNKLCLSAKTSLKRAQRIEEGCLKCTSLK